VLAGDTSEADAPDERSFIECVQAHAAIDVAMVTPAADANPWLFPDRFFDACEQPASSPRHYLYDALCAAAARRGAGLVLDGAYGELGPSFAAPIRSIDRLRHGGVGGAGRAISAVARRVIRRGGGHRRMTTATPFASWLNAGVRDDVLHDCGVAAEMAATDRLPQLRAAPDPVPRIGYPPLWRKQARSHVATKAWSIEVTCPFRDPRVWQYCAGLPSGLAWRGGYNRYLLRAAMDGVLPPAIQWRTTKAPFSPDYYARMRRDLEWARTLCASVTPGETAAQLLDIRWLRAALAAISAADLRHSNIELVFLLQGSAMAIQFVRWFERTGEAAA
jgi:asparagine synthase (glutamine-hydrolysing)